jgi:hypothetical protein
MALGVALVTAALFSLHLIKPGRALYVSPSLRWKRLRPHHPCG